jgi:hypothetical protein
MVYLKVNRKSDIVPNQLKPRVPKQVLNVQLGARKEVIQANHLIAAGQQPVHKVGAQEACAPRDEISTTCVI